MESFILFVSSRKLFEPQSYTIRSVIYLTGLLSFIFMICKINDVYQKSKIAGYKYFSDIILP
jgi:hypothetical protein